MWLRYVLMCGRDVCGRSAYSCDLNIGAKYGCDVYHAAAEHTASMFIDAVYIPYPCEVQGGGIYDAHSRDANDYGAVHIGGMHVRGPCMKLRTQLGCE